MLCHSLANILAHRGWKKCQTAEQNIVLAKPSICFFVFVCSFIEWIRDFLMSWQTGAAPNFLGFGNTMATLEIPASIRDVRALRLFFFLLANAIKFLAHGRNRGIASLHAPFQFRFHKYLLIEQSMQNEMRNSVLIFNARIIKLIDNWHLIWSWFVHLSLSIINDLIVIPIFGINQYCDLTKNRDLHRLYCFGIQSMWWFDQCELCDCDHNNHPIVVSYWNWIILIEFSGNVHRKLNDSSIW